MRTFGAADTLTDTGSQESTDIERRIIHQFNRRKNQLVSVSPSVQYTLTDNVILESVNGSLTDDSAARESERRALHRRMIVDLVTLL